MTLLEVVVALAIGGLAISAAVAALQTVLRVHDDNSRFAGEAVMAASLRMSLADWIGDAIPKDGSVDRFRGLTHDAPDGAADELTLLTSSETPLGDAEIEMHLMLAPRDADHAAGLIAVFRNEINMQSQTVVLDTTIRTLRITYLPGRDSLNRWMPGWISASTLPRAVTISLGTDRSGDSGELLRLPIIIPLIRSQ